MGYMGCTCETPRPKPPNQIKCRECGWWIGERLELEREMRKERLESGRKPLVSSIKVVKNPRHWHIDVWNRGGKAGHLVVDAEDGAQIVSRLREHDTLVSMED